MPPDLIDGIVTYIYRNYIAGLLRDSVVRSCAL